MCAERFKSFTMPLAPSLRWSIVSVTDFISKHQRWRVNRREVVKWLGNLMNWPRDGQKFFKLHFEWNSTQVASRSLPQPFFLQENTQNTCLTLFHPYSEWLIVRVLKVMRHTICINVTLNKRMSASTSLYKYRRAGNIKKSALR